jgi:probable addiction module antidote protein
MRFRANWPDPGIGRAGRDGTLRVGCLRTHPIDRDSLKSEYAVDETAMTPAKSRRPVSRSHEAAVVDSFRRDRKLAAAYLDEVLTDGDQKELMLALRRLSEAFGGVPALAQQAGVNPTTLYRTLSADGNPELRTLRALLQAMGLRLSVSVAA